MSTGKAGYGPGDRADGLSQRLRVEVRGAVQGVGFRPFVYRLATELGLTGWVNNSSQGAVVEVEGGRDQLQAFLRRLRAEKPGPCVMHSLEPTCLDPAGYRTFDLRASEEGGRKVAVILPDLATCPECVRELFDPADRRHRYPFTNCTNCGPRFTIIEALPYDRPRTTMKGFVMCPECLAEYEDPADRRFHAQPNACPRCGPHLELWSPDGQTEAARDQAPRAAAEAVRRGEIVAVKGLGGFHLLVDARNEETVLRLRRRKVREEKPFALMYPDLASVQKDCEVGPAEEDLLQSPQSPIVLLRRKPDGGVAASVAPANPYLGVMLPYTPLHHLLLAELGFPVVATSGNRSDEPICTDEREALARLAGIADCFLVHNRPIVRHVDDSIVRLALGRELVLRRARGYAPLPVRVREPLPPLLGVGAHLKNTVAVAVGDQVVISQHLGDLETAPALAAFQSSLADLAGVYNLDLQAVACDLHPDYLSTQAARKMGLPVVAVQHHFAHVCACMAENELNGPVLGVSWDGTGYGPDGTVWGGEFLRAEGDGFTRVAHLRTFRLPGGDRAVREPRRAALGLLYELLGEALFDRDDLAPVASFSPRERAILRTVLRSGLNAPRTSSAGRLFDAVAAILGLRLVARFEGQAAMELEFACAGVQTEETHPFRFTEDVLDWAPLVEAVLEDLQSGRPAGLIAAKFHRTLADMMVAVARQVGEKAVVLTGGCFQNVRLLELAVGRLRAAGFEPYWHQRVPPSDGGIALGQIMAAAAQMRSRTPER